MATLDVSRPQPSASPPTPFSERTAWAKHLTPLSRFVRTATGGAVLLVAAVVAGLVWANVGNSYHEVWETPVTVAFGGEGIRLSLREWVNSGLMTLFFLVVGLEARRELDLGELRERPRLVLPLLAGVGGMAASVAIYLAFNSGRPSAAGWGIALSSDTALALGLLAVAVPGAQQRLRAFVLTVLVVNDLVALAVIAAVYAGPLHVGGVVWAVALVAVIAVVRALGVRSGIPCVLFGIAAWVALLESGIDPVVLGLVLGLLFGARPVGSHELHHAVKHVRRFREQPTPQHERSARRGLRAAIPANERLLALYHPWTSYAIVPLFALANAGLAIDGDVLRDAAGSPVTLGVLLGFLVGKPLGLLGVSLAITRLSRGRLRPPVGWAALISAGTITGVGFTVSLLVACLAFSGAHLDQAKLGLLGAAALASVLTWSVTRATERLPYPRRIEALLGGAPPLVDLAYDVDPARDHSRGSRDALVTVVEYGDFECPFCGRAEPQVRELLRDFSCVRYVWRHLPLSDVHLYAQSAAQAAEAAAAQGSFWPMHDLLLARQDALEISDLVGYAEELGLDVERFAGDLNAGLGTERIVEDVEGADLSGATGTPTFFVNGRRHYGPYDIVSLSAAVRAAEAHGRLALLEPHDSRHSPPTPQEISPMTARTPNASNNNLVKVAYARDQSEAEFLQNLLRDAEIGSVVLRAPGFDVPEFLAGGPRDVLVAASDVHVAKDVLRPVDSEEPGPQLQVRRDRPSRVLAGLLIAAALVALVVCITVGVFG